MNEEQQEELEALQAIYDSDLTEISRIPACFMIKLPEFDFLAERVQLKVSLPANYPAVIPDIEVPMRSKVMTPGQCSSLVQHLQQVASESVGMAMVFTLVDEAYQWISENIQGSSDGGGEDTDVPEIPESKHTPSPVKLVEPKISGGRWEYIIGLVGKPSAGKSTFFNACTNLDSAKIGAHPFTTIEPNIGQGFYSIPCPCKGRESLCDAAYGHTPSGDRCVPVKLKDVAGLVPGAWEGKGRGNRFLNDLLDADVLIHIIDVSGRTNEKGEETTDYDPSNDVRWLQEELHQWIYQNVHSKWDNIVRHPAKLIDMFTGYHANRSTIHAALGKAGVAERELSQIGTWPEQTLHTIVDNFLKIRFPMLLVLNKADITGAQLHINRIEEMFSDYHHIPVSAASECLLQKLVKDKVIQYHHGNGCFTDGCQGRPDLHIQEKLGRIQADVLDRYGSTNIQRALCEAVSLRPPVYAFPVTDLDTMWSIRRGQSQGHLERFILRDCISLRPGSSVEDLHTVMIHYPVQLLTGDFVRAETIDQETGKKRPLKKDELINSSNHVLHIMTTKKS